MEACSCKHCHDDSVGPSDPIRALPVSYMYFRVMRRQELSTFACDDLICYDIFIISENFSRTVPHLGRGGGEPLAGAAQIPPGPPSALQLSFRGRRDFRTVGEEWTEQEFWEASTSDWNTQPHSEEERHAYKPLQETGERGSFTHYTPKSGTWIFWSLEIFHTQFFL